MNDVPAANGAAAATDTGKQKVTGVQLPQDCLAAGLKTQKECDALHTAAAAKAGKPALPAAIASEQSLQALWLSLKCGLAATVVCLVLGVPMAAVLARFEGRWILLLRGLTTLPLVLPPLVGGIALLYLLGRNGLIGHVVGRAHV